MTIQRRQIWVGALDYFRHRPSVPFPLPRAVSMMFPDASFQHWAGAFSLRGNPARSFFGNVFIPKLGPFGDEPAHQVDALGIACNDDLDTVFAQKFGIAGKVFGLSDHHAGDLELNDSASAHHAGAERGV